MFVSGERWDERGVPIGLGGFVLALQGFGKWVGWNVGFRAVLGLLFNPLPLPVDVIPIIAYEGIAMLVRISDTPFFIDDAVNAFLHGIVAIVIPVWDIKACGMAVA